MCVLIFPYEKSQGKEDEGEFVRSINRKHQQYALICTKI